MRTLLWARLVILAGIIAVIGIRCDQAEAPGISAAPPLADTLLTVFSDMTSALRANEPDSFFALIHPDDARSLQELSARHGYSSLKVYLQSQLHGWPDLDTLWYGDIRANGMYARLTMIGPGTRIGQDRERRRYTFLLFKRDGDRWKLSAMSTLEKERYDPYGYKVTYHETDLPPKLRFPRQF